MEHQLPNFKKKYSAGLTILCLCLFCALTASPVHAQNEGPVFNFGVVPQFTAQITREIWLPILNEIEHETGLKIQLSNSATIPAFETQVMVGEFDFAYMNPFIAYKVGQKKAYIPLVKDIKTSLVGIVVVRKDSTVSDVRQLDNKLVAFPAPNAIGATLVIKAMMEDNYGIKVLPKYVQTHSSVYLNVALGRVVAGGGVQKTLNWQDKKLRDMLKVIYRSEGLSPHPIAAHSRIKPSIQYAVKNAFLKLGKSSRGQELLNRIPITEIGNAGYEDYKMLGKFNLDRFYVQE